VVGGSPTFSPDGLSLVYFAPAGRQRHFQLWSIALPTASSSPSPKPPRQLTYDYDFDAISAPAWMG
jgi:Tol biopolymer transport system component